MPRLIFFDKTPMGSFLKKRLLPLLLFLFSANSGFADEGLNILYFFSSSCPRCIEVMPYVKELSKDYKIEGLLYGKGEFQKLPFTVKRGTKEIASKYGIKGVPVLVVLKDGVFKQKIEGVKDIKDTGVIIKAFKMGAMSISEAVEKADTEEFIIAGWVVHKGKYFEKNSKFFITDRQENLLLAPWLPLEAVKSPFKKKRPRLMSDVIDKPVIIKGRIIKTKVEPRFQVKEEITSE